MSTQVSDKEIDQFPYSYICKNCAEERGGTWPKGHVATFHTAVCKYCGKEKALCNIGDFNWPDNKPRGMRD